MIGRKNPAHGSDMGRQSHLIKHVEDADTRRYILAVVRDPCAYCGDTSTTLDHITSASDGGTDSWDNLTGACSFCNSSKATASLLGYLGWRRYAHERERAQAVLAQVGTWRKVGR